LSKTVCIFNQKGGVGKSTTCINLGAGLALKGKKVLLIDMDPQANTTNGVGINDDELEQSIYTVLMQKANINDIIIKTQWDNLYCVPSDITLSNGEITLSSVMSRENVLSRSIGAIRNEYDYILIDCPPSLGLLSINSLVAADSLIIPVNPGYFSVKGIKHLMDTYELVRDNLKPELEIMGALITMYDSRKNISAKVKGLLAKVFEDKVFNTIIRINSAIEYSQDNRVPIIHFSNNCHAYDDYMMLTEEVLTK
jgi:chromosome partitioning protein